MQETERRRRPRSQEVQEDEAAEVQEGRRPRKPGSRRSPRRHRTSAQGSRDAGEQKPEFRSSHRKFRRSGPQRRKRSRGPGGRIVEVQEPGEVQEEQEVEEPEEVQEEKGDSKEKEDQRKHARMTDSGAAQTTAEEEEKSERKGIG